MTDNANPRLREEYKLEPEFTVEVPKEVATYVRVAAGRNERAARECDLLREGLSREERIEELLFDFLNIRPRWRFPDGTVIQPGASSGGEEAERAREDEDEG